jgi:hypothetical protein
MRCRKPTASRADPSRRNSFRSDSGPIASSARHWNRFRGAARADGCHARSPEIPAGGRSNALLRSSARSPAWRRGSGPDVAPARREERPTQRLRRPYLPPTDSAAPDREVFLPAPGGVWRPKNAAALEAGGIGRTLFEHSPADAGSLHVVNDARQKGTVKGRAELFAPVRLLPHRTGNVRE